jgi:Cu2+-exporting ATPase
LFRNGILVKSGDALERLAQVDKLVLDKTGTLTLGKPALQGTYDQSVLEAAACLARASRHPLSRALADAAGPGPTIADVRESPGEGLEAVIDGRVTRLGRRVFAAPNAVNAEDGAPELWYAPAGGPATRFVFADALRVDAAAFAATLGSLEPELLSGDRPTAVALAAKRAGIADWRGGLSPAEKVERLEALKAAGRHPLMVGDGVNDAAAMAAAYVSASPGSAIDISQAAADIVFQGDKLTPIIEAIAVARKARARMLENLGFSALYNVVAIPFAIMGFVTPFIAALAMAGSSLIVMLNALRLQSGARPWTS